MREGVDVKLLAQEEELYVLARSSARIAKERAMRRRKLKWLSEVDPRIATFTYALDRDKLRSVRRREGRYLLRTNLCGREPAEMWRFYIQLTEVEAAFKTLKDDLQLRPIHHQLIERVEAHIFVAFLAYCLHVTLRAMLKPLANGLTPRAVLDKFAAVQMLDVHFPTTDGRTLVLSRHTELNADQKLLVRQLNLELPPQPPTTDHRRRPYRSGACPRRVVKTFSPDPPFYGHLRHPHPASWESRASCDRQRRSA